MAKARGCQHKVFPPNGKLKKKNFIYSLKIDNGIATSQQEKEKVIYNHYHQHTGTYVPRSCTLNFSELGWQSKQLDHLDQPFTEEETKAVIMGAPREKVPGPDGFIGIFLQYAGK
jgi:hypothetical protein